MLEPWQAMVVVAGSSLGVLLAMRAFMARRSARPRKPVAPEVAYDKAKYHHETVEAFALPEERACNMAAFFLSWLIRRGLTSRDFERTARGALASYKAGAISIQTLYLERFDGCLVSSMLDADGNAFASAYFDFTRGQYLNDYKQHLQKALPSELHVEYTPENERLIHGVIDTRYAEWKARAGS